MVQSSRQCKRFLIVDRLLWLAAAGICAWSTAAASANAEEARPRVLLGPSQIVSEMQNRQLPTRGVQVRLAAPVTAASPNPRLEIEAVTLLSAHEMRLRMACSDRSQCLPFFAIATYPETMDPVTVAINPGRQPAGGEQPAPSAKPVAGSSAASASASTADPAEKPILRSGSPATLDFDGDRVHVRIEVICLQSGAAGDKIRVTTRDHKQVYVAEIVAPTLLKGTF